jgi:hypothetical protein
VGRGDTIPEPAGSGRTAGPIRVTSFTGMWADSNLDELGEGIWWAGVEAVPAWPDVGRSIPGRGTLLGPSLDFEVR